MSSGATPQDTTIAAISAHAFIRHQTQRSTKHHAEPRPEQEVDLPRLVDGGEPRHDGEGDHQGQHRRGPGHPHQGAAARLGPQPRAADEPPVDVVGPVRRPPVEVGVDGRREGREHARQHEAAHAGRQQLGHPADVGGLAVRLHEARGQPRIGGKQHQQPDPQRQPQQAAHEHLGEGEHHRRGLRVAVGAARHRPLGEVAAAVRHRVDEPQQPQQREDREGDVLAVPGREPRGSRRAECRPARPPRTSPAPARAARRARPPRPPRTPRTPPCPRP